MGKTIQLSDYEYTLCELFSKESAKTQQPIEFGQKETLERSIEEIARDNMIGKMAEVAVSKVLRVDFGKKFPVNYDVYQRGECDDYDIVINQWKLDIKSTRKGHWLLFETKKARFRAETGTLPDVIVMCRTPWDLAANRPASKSVEIVGCVSMERLVNSANVIRKGECIPGTRCQLQADNYAVEFERLSDFNSAAEYMFSHQRSKTKWRNRGND